MTNGDLLYRGFCPNCASKLTKTTLTAGIVLDVSEHRCPKCGLITWWDRSGDISFDSTGNNMKAKDNNEIVAKCLFDDSDSTVVVDQTIIASSLIIEIYKYRNEKKFKEDDLKMYVKFFDDLFDKMIEKSVSGQVSNKQVENMMSLMCSVEFLKAAGGNKEYRHFLLDAYLLSVCRTLYSNLEMVDAFESAEKYYS